MTEAHQSPPQHITHDGKRWPVQTLIARNDRAMLATLGIYKHRPLEPGIPFPLGKEWVETDGEWFEETIGTEAEIQAAIDAAAAAAHEAALAAEWAQQAADRAKREANESLAEPTTPENLSQQLAAIRLLSGV